jgi:hypothetical protein
VATATARIVADLDEMLEAHVEALEVLAHEDEVDVLETPAGDERARRPQVGEEGEFLAKAHVGRAEASAHGRGERPFQREARVADALDGGRGQRVLVLVEPGHAGEVGFPYERSADRLQHLERGVAHLRADAVAGNEGRGDFLLCGIHSS